MTQTLSLATVHTAALAYSSGAITEEQLINALVALPPVKQAPLPDVDWYDAIVVNRGPVYELRHETYDGVIPAEVYVHAVKAMLAAGHEA